ncbi:MAG: hypothetical protein ABIP06_12905 [Pyrinomonadaceae bacterium]
MKQLTENQRKIVLGVGIFAIVAALLAVGISIGRGNGFPLTTPLLITVGAILIMLANKK